MTKNEKIVFFFTGMVYGGGERVTLDIARALKREGRNVEVVLLYARTHYKRLPDDLPLVFLGASKMFSGISAVSAYLRRERPKVVLSTQEHAHLVVLIARMISGIRARVVLRMGIPLAPLFMSKRYFSDRIVNRSLARILFPRADAIIAVSGHIAREYRVFGIPEGKIHAIGNPLRADFEKLADEPADHPFLRNPSIPVVVSFGRLEKQKDFQTLVSAFADVVKRVPARLLILGDGSERGALLKSAEELGIGASVSIPGGYIENPLAYFSKAALFVLSSRLEGFPNVLTEAMASGTPVVSTDCISGPREILAPGSQKTPQSQEAEFAEYGILVPVGDVPALARAIEKMLTDPEFSSWYAGEGRKRALDFTMEKIFPRYKKALGVK